MRRVWTIPARVREFTGRDELLAELETALAAGRAGGGVRGDRDGWGRQDHHGDRVRPPPRRRVRRGVVGARRGPGAGARAAGRAGPRARPGRPRRIRPAVAVARLLGELAGRERWLVVFDNAEDPRALAPLLPARPGPGADHLPQPGVARRRRAGRGAGVHPGRVGGAAAHARPGAERGGGGSGRGRRSGTCRWRSSRPGRCCADAGLDVETYLRLLRRAGRASCWPRTPAGPIRCRWPRRGRWRSTGSPPTTRPRWTCSPWSRGAGRSRCR